MHPSHPDRRACAALLLAALAVAGVAAAPAARADPEPDSGSGRAPAPAAAAADVNPMTATPLAVEALRRKLAEAQLQARLEAELTNIERSRSERRRIAHGEPANLAAAAGGGASLAAPSAAAAATPPSVSPPRRSHEARPRGEAPQAAAYRGAAGAASLQAPLAAAAQFAGAPAIMPRLLGVIRDGRTEAALVEVQGRVVRIEADSSAAGVSVGAIGNNQAIVNSRPQQLPVAANRIVLPALASSAASTSAASASAPVSAASAAETLFPGLTLGVPAAPAGTPSEPQSADPSNDPAPLRP
jgi:hypothetical protein